MRSHKNRFFDTQMIIALTLTVAALGNLVYVTYEQWTWNGFLELLIPVVIVNAVVGIAMWFVKRKEDKRMEQKKLRKLKKQELATNKSQTNSYKSPLSGQIQ